MSTKIVGGRLKGRTLLSVPGNRVRPTSSLLRKILFESLGQRVGEIGVLDLFAGIGSLGLEALSRGANRCLFVEADKKIAAVLRKNISRLGLEDRATVRMVDAEAFCRKPIRKYDGVFVDPPYMHERVPDAHALGGLVEEGGWMVIQHPVAHNPGMPEAFSLWKSKRQGPTALTFLQKERALPV